MMILIIILIIILIGIVVYLYFANTEVVEYEYDDFRKIMTVKSKSKTGRLFTNKYIGSCTVWRRLPSYERCNVFEEEKLSELYAKWKHINNTKH